MFLRPPLLACGLALTHLTLSTPAPSQQPILKAPEIPASHHQSKNHISEKNAPFILNTLHASLRQFPSSLHHNGVSYFLASVPEGSIFYHGTQRKEAVTGMEWLALEIEHAEMFARPRGPRGRRPPDVPPGDDEGDLRLLRSTSDVHASRSPEGEFKAEEEEKIEGYLHIYQTKHALKRLLYIDGMSAAKCPLGTLDSTDAVLLNETLDQAGTDTSRRSSPAGSDAGTGELPSQHPGSDYDRARGLCKLGEKWALDGFIRMEAGFEIILCDFEKNLRLLSSRQRASKDWAAPGYPPPKESSHAITSVQEKQAEEREIGRRRDDAGLEEYLDVRLFEYIRALEQRYNGLPNGRIQVDYSTMVSAYFHPDLNLTNPSTSPEQQDQPRLTNNSQDELDVLRDELDFMLRGGGADDAKQGIEWQAIADLIITRYSTRLPYLAHNETDLAAMTDEVGVLLDVYIDYANVTRGLEEERGECKMHFLRSVEALIEAGTASDGSIFEALKVVTGRICTVLFDIRDDLLSSATSHEQLEQGTESYLLKVVSAQDQKDMALAKDKSKTIKEQVLQLMEWLNWSTFKECGKCAADEVCFVAIWPWGSLEDHQSPGCSRAVDLRGRGGYWRNFA